MKLTKKADSGIQEGDMTAMIDMVFQLICFFMVIINFTEADQNEKITLPVSELAKAPEEKIPYPITMHVTRDGMVVVGGEEIAIAQIPSYLSREKTALSLQDKKPGEATIVIRGDMRTKTGRIQELIGICQNNSFDRFALRAKEEVKH